jgi:RNA polymerase sigma-70 factor, ECF subfamily
MSGESDQELVLAVFTDRHVYGRLIGRYEHKLRRYLSRFLGPNRELTDDVLQDVFIKAYLNLNDYDQSRSFAPWLYRIAHNEAINHLRKLTSGVQTVSGEDAQIFLEQVADPENPDSLFWKGQSSQHLRKCLDALETKYRDVLVLRYLEEQSYDAIAEILRLPPGTVATLLRRGLLRLREIYHASGAAHE